jgi:hypothetical protein
MTARKTPLAPPGATKRRTPKDVDARVALALRSKLEQAEAQLTFAQKALDQARSQADSAKSTRDALDRQLADAHRELTLLGIDPIDGSGHVFRVPERIARLKALVAEADKDRAARIRADQDARHLAQEIAEAHEALNAMLVEADDVNGHPKTLPGRLAPILALLREKEVAVERLTRQTRACHEVLDDAMCSRDDRAGDELSLAARIELAVVGASLAVTRAKVRQLSPKGDA